MNTEHQEKVARLAERIKKIAQSPGSKRLNIVHGSTNSTRTETSNDFLNIDISDLNHVLEVNTDQTYALVEPNVSLDALLKETLRYDLIPEVIAEFPGITVGGAINGASLESSSFKYGQFNDTASEYELLLGNGELLHASPQKNSDLFNGIAGSYGTLGLLTSIQLRLRKAKPYVHLTFEPLPSLAETVSVLQERIRNTNIDYAEAVILDKNKGVVITGRLTENVEAPLHVFSHAHDPWFYQQAQVAAEHGGVMHETVPIFDYIFRYNRGAFWMGDYALTLLHFPHHRLMRFLLNPWMNTRKLYDALHAMNISQEYFIQDFYVPSSRTTEFLEYSDTELGIYPLWLCPIKPTQSDQRLSPHYVKEDMLIDVGIWGQSESYVKDPIGMNRKFEAYAASVGARKMLYAHAYYTHDEFWRIYDYEWYKDLREKYHATDAFPEIWEKVHVIPHEFHHHLIRGSIKMMLEAFETKY